MSQAQYSTIGGHFDRAISFLIIAMGAILTGATVFAGA